MARKKHSSKITFKKLFILIPLLVFFFALAILSKEPNYLSIFTHKYTNPNLDLNFNLSNFSGLEPDNHIVYSKEFDLYSLNLRSGKKNFILNGARATAMVISQSLNSVLEFSDASKKLVISDINGNNRKVIYESNSGERLFFTENDSQWALINDQIYSNDGNKIILTFINPRAYYNESGEYENNLSDKLVLIDLVNKSAKVIKEFNYNLVGNNMPVGWSEDNNRVYMLQGPEPIHKAYGFYPQRSSIWEYDLANNTNQKLFNLEVSEVENPGDFYYQGDLLFSLDRTKLAFKTVSLEDDTTFKWDIKIFDITTGSTTDVINYTEDITNFVGWSPDGNGLLYKSDKTKRFSLYSLSTKKIETVSDPNELFSMWNKQLYEVDIKINCKDFITSLYLNDKIVDFSRGGNIFGCGKLDVESGDGYRANIVRE